MTEWIFEGSNFSVVAEGETYQEAAKKAVLPENAEFGILMRTKRIGRAPTERKMSKWGYWDVREFIRIRKEKILEVNEKGTVFGFYYPKKRLKRD